MPNALPPDIDDGSIPNEELLYYRVFPDPDSITPIDQATGQYRPTSGALKDERGPLSVDRSSLSTPEQTRDRNKSQPWHVAAFSAGTARKYGCRVVPDPQPATATEPANTAHVSLFGNHESGNGALNYKSQSRRIAREPGTVIVLLNENVPSLPKKPGLS